MILSVYKKELGLMRLAELALLELVEGPMELVEPLVGGPNGVGGATG